MISIGSGAINFIEGFLLGCAAMAVAAAHMVQRALLRQKESE